MKFACLLPVLTSFLAACGAAPVSVPKSPTTANASGAHSEIIFTTGAQLPVAHWKTGDGRIGLVFDRSTAMAKVRVDGVSDIVELTPEERRSAYGVEGTLYRSPTGKHMLFISTAGRMEYYRGGDTFTLGVVERAEPLGTPTVTGTAQKVKLPNQLEGERFAQNSVRVRFPSFTTNDASNLDKVGQAFDKADAAMLVHYVAKSNGAKFEELPYGVFGVGYGGVVYTSDVKFDPKVAKGLQRFGGIAMGFSENESKANHQVIQMLDGYPQPLADGTPGMVWEVDPKFGSLTFITLDGGRYRIDTGSTAVKAGYPVVVGIGAADAWPAPIQHAWAGSSEITGLVKIGAAPQKFTDEIVAADDAWNKCAQDEWKKLRPALEKVAVTDMNWDTREARMRKLREGWSLHVRDSCKANTEKLERIALSFIEERVNVRMAIYEKAKAKFGK